MEKRYKIKSIYGAEKPTTCDRCSKLISWVAKVETPDGFINVGVDCAERLEALNVDTAKKIISNVKKVSSWFEKADKVYEVPNAYLKSIGKPNETVRFIFKSGLRKSASVDFLSKYLPELYSKII